MRINPGLQVLSLVQGTIQIGTGHRARWITGLSAGEQEFVLSLCGTEPADTNFSQNILSTDRQRAILSVLSPVLIDQQLTRAIGSASQNLASTDSTPSTQTSPQELSPHQDQHGAILPDPNVASGSENDEGSMARLEKTRLPARSRYRTRASNKQESQTPTDSRLIPDVLQWSAAYELDASPIVVRRSEARVAIHGLGRTGQLLAAVLASSGIGSLLLCDPLFMHPGDVGAGTTGIGSVGQLRARALATSLQRSYPKLIVADTSTRDADAPPVDLAVILAGTMLPQLADLPLDQRLLPVLFTDAGVRIGPLVIPGMTICAGCAWEQCDPTLRIVAQGDHFGHCTSVKPESSLAVSTAGSVATQILMALDQINIPSAAENMLIIDLATGATSQVPARARAGCTCMDQRAA